MNKQEEALYAKELLANPLFLIIQEDIEKELLREWRNSHLIDNLSPTDQKDLREQIWHRVQAVEHISQILRKYIQEGYIRNPEEKEVMEISKRKPMEVV